MDDRRVDVLLIGGGVASAACAAQLREDGFAGSILLVGREPDPPYDRPPISKGYLAGTTTREDALYLPAGWYEEHDVELLVRTSAMRLDPDARTATLSTKATVSFEHALVATGANVRRLAVEGDDLDGLHYLRALGNADRLRAELADAERVVCIGGSYIGTEIAATATAMGKRAAIVMQEDVTLQAGFGARAGGWVQALLEEHGVEVHGGQQLARFTGHERRVRGVECASGLALEADVVVLGVGAVPDVMLARGAGLELGETGGVRCDAALRTSAEGIWAAGDVCEYDSVVHGRRLRIEHWDAAIEQGRTAARGMLGGDEPHRAIPYFFSDLADWASLAYVGPAESWDREALGGSPAEGSFTTWYLRGERVVAALAVGDREDDLARARELIASGGPLGDV